MKKGQKFQRWKGLHIKAHPLSWFVERIGTNIRGACAEYHIESIEQCQLYYEMQSTINARFTEYPR